MGVSGISGTAKQRLIASLGVNTPGGRSLTSHEIASAGVTASRTRFEARDRTRILSLGLVDQVRNAAGLVAEQSVGGTLGAKQATAIVNELRREARLGSRALAITKDDLYAIAAVLAERRVARASGAVQAAP